MKQIISTITKLTGIVTPVIFAASAIHDVGYFWIVGWKFQGLAALADYLTATLDWLPTIAAGCVGYLLLSLIFMNAIPAGQMTKPDAPRDRSLKQFLRVLGGVGIFVVCSAACYFLVRLSSIALIGLVFPLGLVWAGVIALCSWRIDLNERVGEIGHLALILVPWTVFSIFLWGVQRAYLDLAPGGELYTFVRAGDGKEATTLSTSVKLLRIYQNGVLVRSEAEAKNQYFRWDQVRLLELTRPASPNQPFGCIQLGWFCKV